MTGCVNDSPYSSTDARGASVAVTVSPLRCRPRCRLRASRPAALRRLLGVAIGHLAVDISVA